MRKISKFTLCFQNTLMSSCDSSAVYMHTLIYEIHALTL